MKIYKNQSYLTLSLITNEDLTNVTSQKIKFRRPDGTDGEWVANINGSLVEYNVQNNDLNYSGTWVIWIYLVFSDSRIAIGEPSNLVIYEQGT